MNVVHLTDSPFHGGPERQMLGLSLALPASVQTTILCFRDHASSRPFLKQLDAAGIASRMIGHANPHFLRMIADVAAQLRLERADVLVCQGYKADVIGWFAARRVGIPVISVSRGWTAHTLKVRAYEALDRRMLLRMDAVVCVSAGQAAKVARAGVVRDRLHVIRNSVDPAAFGDGRDAGRAILDGLFASPRSAIIAGIGRQSPEKGFDQLVEAARLLIRDDDRIGIVLVGDGPDRPMLEALVRSSGLESSVVFAGFRTDVARLLPGADILAQASHTEGMPNVVLEACAAGLPVVATDVGGTSEIIEDGVNGFLVPAADPPALARRLLDLVRSPDLRQQMGDRGRDLVRADFSFARQAAAYEDLFAAVVRSSGRHSAASRRAGDDLPPRHLVDPVKPPAPEESTANYHLSELQIAQDSRAPGHLLPPIPPGCRAVLDIGCGAGQTLIASRLGGDVLAYGVDPDGGALALGRTLTSRVHFAAAAGEHLPFASQSFDLVFSRVALPYMNIPRALNEIRRVLRPDGSIWLSLHPPGFAFRAIAHAIRSGSVRGAVFPLYSLLNGFLLHLLNLQLRWPFGRKRFESNQTAAGIRAALTRARFHDIRLGNERFFVVTARRS